MKPPRLMLRRSLPSISPWVRASISFIAGLVDRRLDLVGGRDLHRAGLHLERRRGDRRRRGVRRALFGRPLHPAAVEQRHVGVAVVVENPPQARRVDAAALVVGDHARVVRDAEPRHQRLELLRRRQERRRRLGIADPVAVDEHRFRNVAVAVAAGADVDDADVAVVEVLREPRGVDEQLGTRVARRRTAERRAVRARRKAMADCNAMLSDCRTS